MKKSYQKPDIKVVSLERHIPILAGSPAVEGEFQDGGGGSAPPKSRQGQGFLFDED